MFEMAWGCGGNVKMAEETQVFKRKGREVRKGRAKDVVNGG